MDVATLIAVVVLPTPPFWLATATMRVFPGDLADSVIWPIIYPVAHGQLSTGGSRSQGETFHVEREEIAILKRSTWNVLSTSSPFIENHEAATQRLDEGEGCAPYQRRGHRLRRVGAS